jgi:hypothetical protein
MSEEGGFGTNAIEKFFGLIVVVMGILLLYYTVTSTETLLAFTALFMFLSIALVVVGFFLMTAKTE